MSETDIIYRVATVNDTNSIMDFIREFYYPEEPVTISCEPKMQDEKDEAFSKSVIPFGTSIMAIDLSQNEKIVGVALSGPTLAGEHNHMLEDAKEFENTFQKWSHILLLLAQLEQESNIYERYNVDKALHIHVLGVDRQYRGRSIGINLFKKSFELGKSLGYLAAKADCTSVFSIRLAEKLQMECLYQLAYIDFKDINGIQVFVPPAPHTHIKTFGKIL